MIYMNICEYIAIYGCLVRYMNVYEGTCGYTEVSESIWSCIEENIWRYMEPYGGIGVLGYMKVNGGI